MYIIVCAHHSSGPVTLHYEAGLWCGERSGSGASRRLVSGDETGGEVRWCMDDGVVAYGEYRCWANGLANAGGDGIWCGTPPAPVEAAAAAAAAATAAAASCCWWCWCAASNDGPRHAHWLHNMPGGRPDEPPAPVMPAPPPPPPGGGWWCGCGWCEGWYSEPIVLTSGPYGPAAAAAAALRNNCDLAANRAFSSRLRLLLCWSRSPNGLSGERR